MVKGEIFQPTDVNGNPVDVFVYKGTTYAPLRALAEAYGLEVSYDGEAKMAVVEEPEEAVEPSAQPVIPGDYSDWSEEEEAAYQEFKGMWNVEVNGDGAHPCWIVATYTGDLSEDQLIELLWEDYGKAAESSMIRLLFEKTNAQFSAVLEFYWNKNVVASVVMMSGKIENISIQK